MINVIEIDGHPGFHGLKQCEMNGIMFIRAFLNCPRPKTQRRLPIKRRLDPVADLDCLQRRNPKEDQATGSM